MDLFCTDQLLFQTNVIVPLLAKNELNLYL
jgi:hypothetical protein